MTYRELYSMGQEKLCQAGISEFGNDAWLLLSRVSGFSRAQYLMHMMEPVEDSRMVSIYEELLARRSTRYPLQYILKETEFMGLSFYVDERVLIPRQDTEKLVEEALKIAGKGSRILDMCTGSGCIAVSLAVLGGADVTAADLSGDALEVAQINAGRNGCKQLRLIQSDLFSGITDRDYDIIVSNPPYIPTEQILGLMPEVRDFEPHMALDGRESGLYFYQQLAVQSRDHLRAGGWILWEIGCDQAEDTTTLLEQYGYQSIEVVRDEAGLNRVVKALWSGYNNRRQENV